MLEHCIFYFGDPHFLIFKMADGRHVNVHKVFLGQLYFGVQRSALEAEFELLGLPQPDVGLYIVTMGSTLLTRCLKDIMS